MSSGQLEPIVKVALGAFWTGNAQCDFNISRQAYTNQTPVSTSMILKYRILSVEYFVHS